MLSAIWRVKLGLQERKNYIRDIEITKDLDSSDHFFGASSVEPTQADRVDTGPCSPCTQRYFMSWPTK